MKKIDGHVHTPFCPHGSSDALHEYAERAIRLGFTELTFTEHAPLPAGFTDPVPDKDSSLPLTRIEQYIHDVQEVKKEYSKDLMIKLGFEVDYIEGFEAATASFLDEYGEVMDDGILSVHFLLHRSSYYCLDYSEEGFDELSRLTGSPEKTYELYYKTVERSILADLGKYKPKRIGHITLAHKFKKLFPAPEWDFMTVSRLLELVRKAGYELDYNTAGLRKTNCRVPYPYEKAAVLAREMGIPLVYGSDAHIASDTGADYETYEEMVIK
ncbi:histidinol-phosphatase HisJ [Metabacillus sp. 84]|uniref:histidinol-phosphatase HisJ n=1 Tax=Metabacillus sp. 84 TaxID=3404705 RepID=UPI003CEC1EBB